MPKCTRGSMAGDVAGGRDGEVVVDDDVEKAGGSDEDTPDTELDTTDEALDDDMTAEKNHTRTKDLKYNRDDWPTPCRYISNICNRGAKNDSDDREESETKNPKYST